MADPVIVSTGMYKYGCQSGSDLPCGRISDDFQLQPGVTYAVSVDLADIFFDLNIDVPGKDQAIQLGVTAGTVFVYRGIPGQTRGVYIVNPNFAGTNFTVTFTPQ